jgi:hypothetical protein
MRKRLQIGFVHRLSKKTSLDHSTGASTNTTRIRLHTDVTLRRAWGTPPISVSSKSFCTVYTSNSEGNRPIGVSAFRAIFRRATSCRPSCSAMRMRDSISTIVSILSPCEVDQQVTVQVSVRSKEGYKHVHWHFGGNAVI